MICRNYVSVETTIFSPRDLQYLGSYTGLWCHRHASWTDIGRKVRIPPISLPDGFIDCAYLEHGRFGNGELEVEFSSLKRALDVLTEDLSFAFTPNILNAASTLILAIEYSQSSSDWRPGYSEVGVPYSPGDYVDLSYAIQDLVCTERLSWSNAGSVYQHNRCHQDGNRHGS